MTRHRVAAVALIAALLATARAEIFVSIDVPKDIPDHDTTGITSTVTVDLEGPVSDVNLRLDDLGHTCDADLHVELTPPSGTAVVLLTSFSENGILTGLGCGVNFTSTILDDQSPTNLTMGVAPYRGPFNVDHATVGTAPLSRLNGVEASGVWTLAVSDRELGDAGGLYHWSLDVTTVTSSTLVSTTTTTLPEDTGFVPRSKTSAKCEGKMAKLAGKLTAKISACHAKSGAARAASKTFDEEGCESKAKAAFVAGSSKGCPPCVGDRGVIADVVERAVDGWNGLIYCDGTTPF